MFYPSTFSNGAFTHFTLYINFVIYLPVLFFLFSKFFFMFLIISVCSFSVSFSSSCHTFVLFNLTRFASAYIVYKHLNWLMPSTRKTSLVFHTISRRHIFRWVSCISYTNWGLLKHPKIISINLSYNLASEVRIVPAYRKTMFINLNHTFYA